MSIFPQVWNPSNVSLDFFKPDDDDWPCEVRRYWMHLQPFVNLVRALLVYVTSFIIVSGVTLNLLSFVVLSSPVISDSSLSIYLRALAISDIGALIFNYATSIARSQSEDVNRLFMDSKLLCDVNAVTMELFQFTSTWLIVCLTWDRLLAIVYPFGKCKNSSESSTLATIVTLVIVSLTVSLTKLYIGGYESDSVFEFAPCRRKPKPWASTMHLYIALSTWLPLIFIFFGNVLLIICIRRTVVIRDRLTRKENAATGLKVNRTLLVVSLVHLILLLPLGVVETVELYWDVVLTRYPSLNEQENELYVHWLQNKLLLKWCRGMCFHLYHWNFAINFFLYYLTGKKFRNSAVATLKRWTSCLHSRKNMSLSKKCLIHVFTVSTHCSTNKESTS